MTRNILILGATGMLGQMVEKVLSADSDLTVSGTHISEQKDSFYFRAEKGIDKLEHIYRETGGYDYMINCIGITADKIRVEDSDSIILATLINSCFPHQLAKLAERFNFRVIHISTDGVFSGSAQSYDEDAAHDCPDVYGKTKSIGEVLTCEKFLNIRCSIIGPSPIEKRGFFEWFRSQPDGSTVRGHTNHIWNGITTLQFAEICRTIIKNDKFDRLRAESAVFHYAPNKPITKYELLNIFKEALGKNIVIEPAGQSDKKIRRILESKYEGLRSLCDHDTSMVDAIKQLITFI